MSNTISRNHTEGSWLSSPCSNCPSHLLHDTTDESKSVSAWPVSQSQVSMLNIDCALNQVDKDHQVETATTSYRLFGIDLIDHSKNSTAVGKASSHAVNITAGTAEVSSSMLSSSDTGHKSDTSKEASPSMERKQELQQVTPKDGQSKQTCIRSRIKVLNTEYIFR